MDQISRRGFLGWSAVGISGLLLPSQTVVGPSIDIRQPERWIWPRISFIDAMVHPGSPGVREFIVFVKRPGQERKIYTRFYMRGGQIMTYYPPQGCDLVIPRDTRVGVGFSGIPSPGMLVWLRGFGPDGSPFVEKFESGSPENNLEFGSKNGWLEFRPLRASLADSSRHE